MRTLPFRGGDSGAQVKKAELDDLDHEIADLPEVRDAAKANADREGGGERNEIPFSEWQLWDQITALLSLVGGIVLLATSWLAAKTSLDASQEPIFIENPGLSWLISFVVPGAAIAAKSVYSIFDEEASRKLFRKIVYAATGISFVAFWALFAVLFKSLSGEDDPLAEPDALAGWGFVFLQGVTEIGVATSLMLSVSATFARYTPEYTHKNSKKERLRRRAGELVAEIDQLEERVKAARSRLAELSGILAFNLERAELAFAQARARRTDGLV